MSKSKRVKTYPAHCGREIFSGGVYICKRDRTDYEPNDAYHSRDPGIDGRLADVTASIQLPAVVHRQSGKTRWSASSDHFPECEFLLTFDF